jgi:AcrR family transcriptional regulator
VERVVQPGSIKRRVPAQERSRVRVQRILDEAAALVVKRGVESLSTRDIAQAAGVPVASLYQYFADKEDVLLALAERDMAEMDERVAEDVGRLERPTIAEFVRTVMSAFVGVYHRRPAFVEIYLRGRTNVAVNRFGREHNARIAESLRSYALDRGLADERLSPTVALLAVEIGDRVFQLAFEHKAKGDPELIEEGITLMTSYLERYAA